MPATAPDGLAVLPRLALRDGPLPPSERGERPHALLSTPARRVKRAAQTRGSQNPWQLPSVLTQVVGYRDSDVPDALLLAPRCPCRAWEARGGEALQSQQAPNR